MEGEQKIGQIADEHASRERDAHRRHGLAFVASAAAHALILIALVFLVPEVERPHHDWVLAYLVEFEHSGAAGRGSADAGASAAKPRTPQHPHRRAARSRAKPPSASWQSAGIAAAPVPGAAAMPAGSAPVVPVATGATGARIESTSAPPLRLDGGDGRGRDDADAGDGSGSWSAHVEYGRNPVPIYPIAARRRAQQGNVLLRVEVGVDGSVERVEIAQSSGFDSLDESATETVRKRWRFVPARRDGIAVSSWCEVPIRFQLTEAHAN